MYRLPNQANFCVIDVSEPRPEMSLNRHLIVLTFQSNDDLASDIVLQTRSHVSNLPQLSEVYLAFSAFNSFTS